MHSLSHWTILRIAFVWNGNVFEDPISGKTYRKMLPYGRMNPRPNALAPHSLSLERHRTLWIHLKQNTDFFKRPMRFLHLAPEYCFLGLFKQMEQLDYVTADLNSPWADHHFDVHSIPFEDDSFDVVMGNHLLEHVKDDLQVMKEFYRVMKPGGWGIFQVPIDFGNPHTEEDPLVTDPRERERLYWQDDHLRLYGYRAYVERLKEAGFEVETVHLADELGEELVARYSLGSERLIHVAHKR
ncbi:MAG: methyltransferase domain-containing protein [Flavobacteriales bacterium]|nr:methyltransferase domain-containing protein [Flavobacteriales bacterium]